MWAKSSVASSVQILHKTEERFFSEQQGPMKPVNSFYPSLSDGLVCINRATLNAPHLSYSFFL